MSAAAPEDRMEGPVGLLVMAYGTASGPDDIERYYTDIRGGRRPSPDHLAELTGRYAAIGNRFPLLDLTGQQAEGLERELNARAMVSGGPAVRSYLGMKHSPPFIPEAVERMRQDGIHRAIGVVMAPHWSGMSVETYVERVEKALAETGDESLRFTFVRGWHDHPRFVDFLASRVSWAMGTLTPEERDGAAVVFSAHSLPVRDLPDGTQRCKLCAACPEGCRYVEGLRDTCEAVAAKLGLGYRTVAWQSAGRTPDPWWGPPLEEVILELALAGHPAVVVCSAGFVADHLEILYDLDIEARAIAEEAGIGFVRTEMPNADPRFIQALAAVVADHLEANP